MAQHRARGNAAPPGRCVRALAEVLKWTAEPQVQDHVRAGQRQAWKHRAALSFGEGGLQRVAADDAIPTSLGESRYQEMLRAVSALASGLRRQATEEWERAQSPGMRTMNLGAGGSPRVMGDHQRLPER